MGQPNTRLQPTQRLAPQRSVFSDTSLHNNRYGIERLAIRTHINQQIKEALATDKTADSEKLRERFEKEAAQDIERLRKRAARLDEREIELQAKLPSEEDDQQVKTARTFADFQTELAQLAEVWDEKPEKEKREFVSLLVDKTVLSVVAPHWVRLIIHWKHPGWSTETIYMRRRFGHFQGWTEEENELLRELYVSADKEVLLSLMPHRTWSAIRCQGHVLGLHREHSRRKLPIDENTAWGDYQFCQSVGIDPTSREAICIVESENTDDDPLSQSPAFPPLTKLSQPLRNN